MPTRLPIRAGREALLGRRGEALTDLPAGGEGRVFVDGEDWRAVSSVAVARGQSVVVAAVEGLCLNVRPADLPEVHS